MTVSFGDGLGDAFVDAIKAEQWDAAKALLRRRDENIEKEFLTYEYLPTLTQNGGCTATITAKAQVYRVGRQVILVWGGGVGATTGTPAQPEIYLSLPNEFNQSVSSGLVGLSWFESDVLAYSGGGVIFDNTNGRLETLADAYAYTTPPNVNGSLPGLIRMGIFATWLLPDSRD